MTVEELLAKVKDKKTASVIGVGLAAVFIAQVVVFKPFFAKMVALEKQKQGLMQKQPILAQISEIEKRLLAYKPLMAQTKDKIASLGELNALAEKSSLNVSSLTPEDSTLVGYSVEKLPVRVDAEGDYHRLGDFISRVESLDRFIKVTHVEIRPDFQAQPQARATDASTANNCRISATFGLFYPAKDILSTE